MAKRGSFTVIQGSAMPRPGAEASGAALRRPADEPLHLTGASPTSETFRAGLEYVACDLRELAKIAPPDRALQVLNLSRLVEAIIQR